MEGKKKSFKLFVNPPFIANGKKRRWRGLKVLGICLCCRSARLAALTYNKFLSLSFFNGSFAFFSLVIPTPCALFSFSFLYPVGDWGAGPLFGHSVIRPPKTALPNQMSESPYHFVPSSIAVLETLLLWKVGWNSLGADQWMGLFPKRQRHPTPNVELVVFENAINLQTFMI